MESEMRENCRKKTYKSFVTVKASVERLREAAKAAKASRSRFANHLFLMEVYQCYWQWLERGCAKKHIRQLNRQLGLHDKKTRQPLKTLILVAKYSPEPKLRSRWIRALEFALAEETEPDDLIDFFRGNGGIAGCARRAAGRDPKRGPPQDSWA